MEAEMHQLREAGKVLATIESEGVTYHLKVASWETGGVYEVWEMVLDKGLEIAYHEHHAACETFFLTRGSAEVTLAGNKVVAKAGDVIHVPPYMPHAMVILEETTWMAYFNGYRFYDVMQERIMLKEHNPAVLEDEEFSQIFGERHDSHRVKAPAEVLQETEG
jgi:quercetin dioxygenase-like cupin family protein